MCANYVLKWNLFQKSLAKQLIHNMSMRQVLIWLRHYFSHIMLNPKGIADKQNKLHLDVHGKRFFPSIVLRLVGTGKILSLVLNVDEINGKSTYLDFWARCLHQPSLRAPWSTRCSLEDARLHLRLFGFSPFLICNRWRVPSPAPGCAFSPPIWTLK